MVRELLTPDFLQSLLSFLECIARVCKREKGSLVPPSLLVFIGVGAHGDSHHGQREVRVRRREPVHRPAQVDGATYAEIPHGKNVPEVDQDPDGYGCVWDRYLAFGDRVPLGHSRQSCQRREIRGRTGQGRGDVQLDR